MENYTNFREYHLFLRLCWNEETNHDKRESSNGIEPKINLQSNSVLNSAPLIRCEIHVEDLNRKMEHTVTQKNGKRNGQNFLRY